MAIYMTFRSLNNPLLATALAYSEYAIEATSGAVQYWNMLFKRP